jgi:hypothetical protein
MNVPNSSPRDAHRPYGTQSPLSQLSQPCTRRGRDSSMSPPWWSSRSCDERCCRHDTYHRTNGESGLILSMELRFVCSWVLGGEPLTGTRNRPGPLKTHSEIGPTSSISELPSPPSSRPRLRISMVSPDFSPKGAFGPVLQDTASKARNRHSGESPCKGF